MKQFLLLILICIIGSVSAQNKGIPLTGKNQIQFYYDEENHYTLRYDDLRGKTFDVVNSYMEKNRLTEKEYMDLNIAKCKHPTLRAIPLKNISGGSTIVKTDAGTVRLIYASKKDTNASNQNLLIVYVYLFSMTPEGKYIDSLFGNDLELNLSYSEDTLSFGDMQGLVVRDDKIIIISTVSDEECFGEREVPYIITKDFKFKEVSQ